MARRVARRYWIAIVLSAVWLVAATAIFSHQRAAEIRRETRQCHQLRDDARANKICADTMSVAVQPLCRFKDADCDRWPLEEERFAWNVALMAVAPVVLAWLIFYAAARVARWRARA